MRLLGAGVYKSLGGARLRLGLFATVSESITLGLRRSAAVMSGLGSGGGVGATLPSAVAGLGISPTLFPNVSWCVAAMGAPMSGSRVYLEGME